MKKHSWRTEGGFENPHGIQAQRLYDAAEAEIIHMFLSPGQVVKPHFTPVNVSFYVLEGELEITIGDEIETIGRDFLVESPANIAHSLRNISASNARVLVIKHPKPAKR